MFIKFVILVFHVRKKIYCSLFTYTYLSFEKRLILNVVKWEGPISHCNSVDIKNSICIVHIQWPSSATSNLPFDSLWKFTRFIHFFIQVLYPLVSRTSSCVSETPFLINCLNCLKTLAPDYYRNLAF